VPERLDSVRVASHRDPLQLLHGLGHSELAGFGSRLTHTIEPTIREHFDKDQLQRYAWQINVLIAVMRMAAPDFAISQAIRVYHDLAGYLPEGLDVWRNAGVAYNSKTSRPVGFGSVSGLGGRNQQTKDPFAGQLEARLGRLGILLPDHDAVQAHLAPRPCHV